MSDPARGAGFAEMIIAGPTIELKPAVTDCVVMSGNGSGFLVAPGLILSALHIYEDGGKKKFATPAGGKGTFYPLASPGSVPDLAAGILCKPTAHQGLLLPGPEVVKAVRQSLPREVVIAGWGPEKPGGTRQLRAASAFLLDEKDGRLSLSSAARACGGDSGGPVVIEAKGAPEPVAIGVISEGDKFCNGQGPLAAISLLRTDLKGIIEQAVPTLVAQNEKAMKLEKCFPTSLAIGAAFTV